MYFFDSRVFTFIQSRKMVHCVFNIELYSFVMKLAIDVIRGQLIASVVQTQGLTIDRVKNTRVELDQLDST